MELYTLAGAAEVLGCTPNRIKSWIDKGYIPDNRIHLGKIKARVLDEPTIVKMKEVLRAIDQDGLTIRAAFQRHFDHE
jgi:hypothetical protein